MINAHQIRHCNYLLAIVIQLLLLLLVSLQVSCFNKPPASPQGLMFDEKTRLGSTPPSCHNKCNDCHPCMAVQVPTVPSHNQVEPQFSKDSTTHYLSDQIPSSYNRYTNYKPLGWKCHCGGHFYNP